MFAISAVVRRRTPLLLGALALAAACTTTEPIGRVPVRLQVRPTSGSANATVANRVDLIISGPGINPNITATFLFDTSGTAQGTLDVPVGSPRVLQLSIYDVNNVLLLQGIDTIDVVAGTNAPAQVVVTPTTGSQPLVISGIANATTATRVDLIVSGPGINPNITASFPFNAAGTAQGTLDLPIGSPRVVQLNIYDASNVLLLQGFDTITVTAGSNAPAQLTFTPATGSQPIIVVVGNYSLTVAPGATSIAVGGTQQYTATVRDAGGTTVTTPVRWASANPAFVTVDSTGLARGVLAGATTITATAFGIAATVPVTVSAP